MRIWTTELGDCFKFELGCFIFRLDGKGGLRVRLDARWRF